MIPFVFAWSQLPLSFLCASIPLPCTVLQRRIFPSSKLLWAGWPAIWAATSWILADLTSMPRSICSARAAEETNSRRFSQRMEVKILFRDVFLGKGRPPTIWCNHIALICFIHCPNLFVGVNEWYQTFNHKYSSFNSSFPLWFIFMKNVGLCVWFKATNLERPQGPKKCPNRDHPIALWFMIASRVEGRLATNTNWPLLKGLLAKLCLCVCLFRNWWMTLELKRCGCVVER